MGVEDQSMWLEPLRGPCFPTWSLWNSGLQPQRSGTLLHAPLDRVYTRTPCPQQCTPSQTRLLMCVCSAASRNRVQAQPLCHLVCHPSFNHHAHRASQLTHTECPSVKLWSGGALGSSPCPSQYLLLWSLSLQQDNTQRRKPSTVCPPSLGPSCNSNKSLSSVPGE